MRCSKPLSIDPPGEQPDEAWRRRLCTAMRRLLQSGSPDWVKGRCIGGVRTISG
jgi:hypothetical protein